MASDPLILPSCTTHEATETVIHGGHTFVPLFCGNCGVKGGHVIRARCNFAFWLCDPCSAKWEPVVGVSLIPDEIVWQKMRQVQLEEHGHLLTPDEAAAVLLDGSSSLSKLARDLPVHD